MWNWTFLVLICELAGIATGAWQVSLVGRSATFRCDGYGSAGVMWDRKTTVSAQPVTVSVGDKISTGFNDRFNVRTNTADTATSFSQLSISAVERSDAAVYECLHRTTGSLLMRTALAVLDDYPKFSATGSPDGSTESVDVSCSLCYSGELKPEMSCIADSTETSQQSQQWNKNTSCVHFQQMFKPDPRRTNFTIKCSFSLTSGGEVYFAHNWTSPPITINYGPTLVTIASSSNQTLFRDGDKLSCTALSNQEIQFHWIAKRFNTDSNNKTPVMQHGSAFTVKLCDFVNNNNNDEFSSNADVVSAATRLALMCVAVSGNRSAVASVIVYVRTSQDSFDKCRVQSPTSATSVHGQLPLSTIILIAVVAVLVILLVAQEVRYRRFKTYADRLYVRPTPQVVTSTSASLGHTVRSVYDELDEGQNETNRVANGNEITEEQLVISARCNGESVSRSPVAEDRQLPLLPVEPAVKLADV